MKLTAKQREELKPEDYAVPGKKKLPIHDRKHVIAAWNLLPRTQGLTSEEIAEAKRRILARAKKFDINTSNWNKGRTPAMESFEGLLSERQEHMQYLMSTV